MTGLCSSQSGAGGGWVEEVTNYLPHPHFTSPQPWEARTLSSPSLCSAEQLPGGRLSGCQTGACWRTGRQGLAGGRRWQHFLLSPSSTIRAKSR